MTARLYDEAVRWIPRGSRVLDLGSGDGEFLERLETEKGVSGEGVEKNPEMVARCIERGLVVHQGYILDGLDQYDEDSFDYVLLLGTFEELENPGTVLAEAFRVGSHVFVSFHNFAFWRIRLQLMFFGRAPVTRAMPREWYNTATVRFFSIEDFRSFVRAEKMKERQSAFFDSDGAISVAPNMRAEYALFEVTR